ncbi:MAG: RraA family protein [Methanobacteriaceae archaeon]|nr:RraA family protein [Methanobacteriaceae archaeon]MDZ4170597.1 RraA family protein [Methanobacteriaceae archaeon]
MVDDKKSFKISPDSLLKKFVWKKKIISGAEVDSQIELNQIILNESKKNKIKDAKLNLVKFKDEYGNFEEFLNQIKLIDTDLSANDLNKILDLVSTPQLSDAMQRITGYNGVIPFLKPVNNKKLMGKVFTVRTHELDWGTSVKAIEMAQKGQILFILSEGDQNAVWGELTSKSAQMKGISGTIIYGACRDAGAIKQIDYPVFSKNIVPNAGKPILEGKINIKLVFEGFEINPGDYVLGDECGVVLIPQNVFEDVIKSLWEIKNNEMNIIVGILEGKPLLQIIGLNK